MRMFCVVRTDRNGNKDYIKTSDNKINIFDFKEANMHLIKHIQNSEFTYNVEILDCSLLSDNAKIQIYRECFAIFGSIECCAEYYKTTPDNIRNIIREARILIQHKVKR